MATIQVQLSESTLARIGRLSAKTGKSQSAFLAEALESHLSDLEALELAEQRLTANRAGLSDSVTQAEMEARYGFGMQSAHW
jgi:predicted DNA-binding protein